jgi:hypothetical protein
MAFMRKLLTSLLLISLVLGNLEVLMDFDLRHVGQDPVSSFSGETTGGSDDGFPHDESDCDHCCHGASHFVGLVAMSQRAASQAPDMEPPLLVGRHESPVFAPPLQPPTV